VSNEINRQEERRLEVKVTPNAGRSEITGWKDGALQLKIAAPPEKGKANAALIEFFAEKLDVKRNAIKITSGLTSGIKELVIDGTTVEQISRLIVKKKQ